MYRGKLWETVAVLKLPWGKLQPEAKRGKAETINSLEDIGDNSKYIGWRAICGFSQAARCLSDFVFFSFASVSAM